MPLSILAFVKDTHTSLHDTNLQDAASTLLPITLKVSDFLVVHVHPWLIKAKHPQGMLHNNVKFKLQ